MESIRKFNITQLKLKIQEKEKTISRNTDLTKTIKSSTYGSDYILSQIEKYKRTIEESQNDIIEYQNQIIDISEGKYDTEYKDEQDEHVNKKNKVLEKKNQEKLKEKESQDEAIARYNKMQTMEKQKYSSENSMRKSLDYYYNVIDTIPDFMDTQLKRMPNNKGFIWRGVYFYGSLPPDSNPHITTITDIRTKEKHIWSFDTYQVLSQNKDKSYSITKTVPRRKIIGAYN